MPSTKGLEVLVRKDRLTGEEWIGLVEARRELIKPHLDSFTFPELGALECLRSEVNFEHAIQSDGPAVTGDERFSLKTQGIFRVQSWSAMERIPKSGYIAPPGGISCPDGTMRVWGLTRSGLWVLASIGFAGGYGYKGRGYERATTVDIAEADLSTIIAETKEDPQEIWKELGDVIKRLAERRKALYDQAVNLARMVMIEELALSLRAG